MNATKQEEMILKMYRLLSRWERFAVFLVLQSMSVGRLTSKTDRYSGQRMLRMVREACK